MKELKHYCPKCGKELIDKSSHVKKFFLLICEDCTYCISNPNIIDISFKSKGLAKALSNLCPYPFEFDDVKCSSMEAFIQSLKVKYPDVQEEICSKTGPFCYNLREMFDDWRETGNVYWKGKEICRQSKKYIMLLTRAYEALWNQSLIFRYALIKVKENGYILDHSIGCDDPSETLLTPKEYMGLLDHLMKDCL